MILNSKFIENEQKNPSSVPIFAKNFNYNGNYYYRRMYQLWSL